MANKQAKTEPTNTKRFVERYQRLAGRFVAGTSLPEIMLAASLCIARYTKNSDFSYPSEIVLNIVLFAVLASAVFALYRLLIRSQFGAHVAGLLTTYFIINYDAAFPRLRHLAEAIIPDSATSFTNALLKLLIVGFIFGIVGFVAAKISHLKQLKEVPLLKLLVFVICFVFAVQVGKMGLRVWEIRSDLAYTVPQSAQFTKLSSSTAANSAKPNVYYLLFDRYASQSTLSSIYGFDNSDLINNLKSQGMTVRDNAYANYPFTMQSVSSTLSANYHTELAKQFAGSGDFQTGFPYRAILNKSPVTEAFKSNGYQYNQVSSWWDFTRDNPSADTNPSKSFRLRVFGKNFWLTDLQRDIVNRSILSPFLLKGLTIGDTAIVKYQLDRNPSQNFFAQIEALNAIVAQSKNQTKPQFTFAHILSPHDPYVFDANGNTPTYDGNRTDNGIDEYKKYTNQLTFINRYLEQTISNIRTNDPTAVIVLQADEGPYPKQFRGTLSATSYYDPKNIPVAQQRQKFGILAAYYLPNTPDGTTIDASVNSFRVVLNQYLGYNLPLLPDCQFSVGDKFKLYNYQLQTGKLKGGENPAACKQYQ